MKKVLLKHSRWTVLVRTARWFRRSTFSQHVARQPSRTRQTWIVVAALLCLFLMAPWLPATAADAPTSDAAKKVEIVKLMQGFKFERITETKNPFCHAFLDDFHQQRNIEYIVPIIQTDDYNDPRLKLYKDKCPKLEFNKYLSFFPSIPNTPSEAFELPPEEMKKTPEEMEKNTTYVLLGTKNFKLWELEMDDNLKNGKEIIFYDQAHNSVGHGLPTSGIIVNPQTGRYRAISPSSCSVLGGSATHEFSEPPQGIGVVESHGVIRHRGKNSLYSLTVWKPSGESSKTGYASLKLVYWDKDETQGRYRVGQFCTLFAPQK